MKKTLLTAAFLTIATFCFGANFSLTGGAEAGFIDFGNPVAISSSSHVATEHHAAGVFGDAVVYPDEKHLGIFAHASFLPKISNRILVRNPEEKSYIEGLKADPDKQSLYYTPETNNPWYKKEYSNTIVQFPLDGGSFDVTAIGGLCYRFIPTSFINFALRLGPAAIGGKINWQGQSYTYLNVGGGAQIACDVNWKFIDIMFGLSGIYAPVKTKEIPVFDTTSTIPQGYEKLTYMSCFAGIGVKF